MMHYKLVPACVILLTAPLMAQVPENGDILVNVSLGASEGIRHYQPDGTQLTGTKGGTGGLFQGAAITQSGLIVTSRRFPTDGFNVFDSATGSEVASFDTPETNFVPADTAIFADGTIAVGDQGGFVHLYSETGVHLRTISDPNLGRVTGIYVDENQDLWVADPGPNFFGGSGIFRFDRTGTLLADFDTDFSMGDLAISSDGTIWTTNFHSDTVINLDATGTVLSRFKTLVDPGSFLGFGIAADDSLYVTSLKSDQVYHYDPTGVLLGSFPIQLDSGNAVYLTVVNGAAPGDSYCVSVPNSTGGAALLSATGSASISALDLVLQATSVPNQFGLFFSGEAQAQLPFGNGGSLCTVGGIVRSPIILVSGNTATFSWDLSTDPGISGVQRNFQYWFRDPAAGGDTFNTSNGLTLLTTP